MTINKKEVFRQIQQDFPDYDIKFINMSPNQTKVFIYQDSKLVIFFCIRKINKKGEFCKKTIRENLADIKCIFSKVLKENLNRE